jgi:antitoxin ParD1/3/4
LPKLAKQRTVLHMTTMNISLPDSLKDFVDHQVSTAGYGTSSEYVRELIRRDQDRLKLRSLLLEGAQSKATGFADADYFAALRARTRTRLSGPR